MGSIQYLIAQESDYKWGVVTKSVGLQQVRPGDSYPLGQHPAEYYFSPRRGRTLPDLTILYITQGSGWFQSTHCPRTIVQAGDAVILFPGEWHSYAPNPAIGWTEAWITFDGQFSQSVIQNHYFNPRNPILNVGCCPSLHAAFESAYQAASKQYPAYQQQLSGYVNLIVGILYAKEQQRQRVRTRDVATIMQARQYMREHVEDNLHMDALAQHLGVSYARLRHAFKTYTGFTLSEYFLGLKIERAKELLSTTPYANREIAQRLSLASPSYFSKLFRDKTGQTPTSFRALFQSPKTTISPAQ